MNPLTRFRRGHGSPPGTEMPRRDSPDSAASRRRKAGRTRAVQARRQVRCRLVLDRGHRSGPGHVGLREPSGDPTTGSGPHSHRVHRVRWTISSALRASAPGGVVLGHAMGRSGHSTSPPRPVGAAFCGLDDAGTNVPRRDLADGRRHRPAGLPFTGFPLTRWMRSICRSKGYSASRHEHDFGAGPHCALDGCRRRRAWRNSGLRTGPNPDVLTSPGPVSEDSTARRRRRCA